MSRDPFKYFRIEARELLEGLTQGVLALEKSPQDKTVVGQMFRLAHTLKGAARIVKRPDLAELAHAVEDVLAPHRSGEVAATPAAIEELLRHVDSIAAGIATLDGPPAAAPALPAPAVPAPALPAPALPQPALPAPVVALRAADSPRAEPVRAPAQDALETVRVDVTELDGLLENLTEASVQIAALGGNLNALGRTRELARTLVQQLALPAHAAAQGQERLRAVAEQLEAALEHVTEEISTTVRRAGAEVCDSRERTGALRLLAAETIFPALERAVRDAVQGLGKRVELTTIGGDVRVDGHVLLAARDALLHMVRNAVDHGIETEAERARAGKPAAGQLRVEVTRRGHRVSFACRDDGRGIDLGALQRKAVAQGVLALADAQAMGADATAQLVFLAGMSTRERVTELSGRGVGLDVVRSTALRYRGECQATTEPGRETCIELLVPISLASVPALLVEAAGLAVALPMHATTRSLRVANTDIARAQDRATILVDGDAIPFAPLAQVLGRVGGGASDRRTAWTVLIISAGGKTAALGVDRLLGTADLVVRPLPALAGAIPLVAGASLDAAGDPQLLLDAAGVIEHAHGRSGTVAATAQLDGRAPILVIDDSLTTRMLEQSILDSAGYDVDVATSAEDALEKCAARQYGLFVCDVEMPGMSGFEFAAHTRAHPTLRETPIILVTSLSAPADRQRGTAVGAAAYIVKSEFEQDHLLQLVKRLLRAPAAAAPALGGDTPHPGPLEMSA